MKFYCVYIYRRERVWVDGCWKIIREFVYPRKCWRRLDSIRMNYQNFRQLALLSWNFLLYSSVYNVQSSVFQARVLTKQANTGAEKLIEWKIWDFKLCYINAESNDIGREAKWKLKIIDLPRCTLLMNKANAWNFAEVSVLHCMRWESYGRRNY